MNLFIKLFQLKRISIFFLIILALMNLAVYGAAGDVDLSFRASAYGNINGNVFAIKEQTDGKILVGGIFTDVDGYARSGLVRFNADGSVDETFYPPDFFSSFGIGAAIYAIGIQSDGKIIVGGNLFGVNRVLLPGLRRLNPDGSLDSSFVVEQIEQTHSILDIEILPDDKILIGGEFRFTGARVANLARLNKNGTVDNDFTTEFGASKVNDLEIQPDGKIVVAGVFSNRGSVRRYSEDGRAEDSSFTPVISNNTVETIELQADGKILVGGNFTNINNVTHERISRLNTDGSVDLSFNANNTEANDTVNDIAVRPSGKIVIGGEFTTYNTIPRQKLAQLNEDGTLDTSFQNNTVLSSTVVNDVEILSNEKVLVGTNFDAAGSPLLLFNTDGTFDPTFAPYIARIGVVREILQQPDGKILVAGEFPFVNGVERKSLARLNADGSLDTSFVPYFNTTQIITAVALQADGKILVGAVNGITLKRLNANGSQDTSFAPNLSNSTSINDIVVLSNGQILVAGNIVDSNQTTRRIAKFNQDGSFDESFDVTQPNNTVFKILQQPDGKILLGGDFTQIGSSARGRIARLNADGSLDNSFNPPGGANGSVLDFDLQTDGKIVLGGNFTTLNGSGNQQRIGRLNANGTLDAAFVQNTNASVLAVKVQPDGKILIGGTFTLVQGVERNNIARLLLSGALDTTFRTSANLSVWDINLQSDGKILLGGRFTKINDISNVRIARLTNIFDRRSVMFDYNGDGRADVSVYRPSTNRWFEYFITNSTVSEQTFGLEGDVIAPADYDGDRKTDIGIFRPSTGTWWYLSSIDNVQKAVRWGESGDIPRPSDFDGDGRADFILYRPSEATWYRMSSGSGQISIKQFGVAGDKPVIGDFDGDGKSDLAIFRPATGEWWYESSLDNEQRAIRWGTSTDTPVPADYDGDGRTDFAVYRASESVWYILNSSDFSSTIIKFGVAEDKPVPADYDGDGKADIAVFRPSEGTWYLLQSSQGFAAIQLGVSTDIPTPSAFIP
jgi:uncharacterized delta-60 repeat protein